jgi:Protein of unknown function
LTRRIAKIAALSLLSCLVLVILLAAAMFWRLSEGPVSLARFTPYVESGVNNQLSGMKAKLGTMVLELETGTYVPRMRFRNVTLVDANGVLIASAPKAAVTLDGQRLLTGEIVAVDLELIGPSIRGQRNLDGRFELGVVGDAAPEGEAFEIENLEDGGVAPQGKSDLGATSVAPNENQTAPDVIPQLITLFAAEDGTSALSSLQEIRVTRARVTLYDEANDANWFAPQADLTFRRMPYGFIVFATADVASADEPWRTEVSATYRRQAGSLSVSARVSNVVPANVSQQIYALSQFAKAKVPLSGVIEMQFDSAGRLSQSSTALDVGAGTLRFPDYFSQTINVEGGSLKFNYDPVLQQFAVEDSHVTVGGAKADLNGKIKPNWGEDGKLSYYDIQLVANNPKGPDKNELGEEISVDGVDFTGVAQLEEQKLQITDLVVRAGTTGVRLNGEIVAGNESAGLKLAGRLKDASAPFVKRLWPPIMAPNTLRWLNANVLAGRVSDGTFHVNLPIDELAKALRNQVLPKGSIDVQLTLGGVRTKYFKNMPALENASGTVRLSDNDFKLDIIAGQASLPSGDVLKLQSGRFVASDLLVDAVPGAFEFNVSGPVATLVQFIALPDISVFIPKGINIPQMNGIANVRIGLKMPLIRDVPRERVQVETALSLADVDMQEVVKGVDLTGGQFAVDYSGEVIDVRGPAKLNGTDVEIVWRKPKSGGEAVTGIEMVLDDKSRTKLGIDLEDYLKGPVRVKVALQQDGEATRADVEADLSKTSLSVAAIGWAREPTDGTKATFSVVQAENGQRVIDDINVSGNDLALKGKVTVGSDGRLKSAALKDLKFGESTYRSVTIAPDDGQIKLDVEGGEFDARPYIGKIASPLSANPETRKKSGYNLSVQAKFDRVVAFRGEVIENASADISVRGGTVAALNASGTYLNGLPIAIKMTPSEAGRGLSVLSTDGGATLRAANFYSKIAGGELEFTALIADAPGSPIRNGYLKLRNFEVRNEAALAELDQRGKPKKSGPRRGGITFKRLDLPFTTDLKFVRLCKVLLRGPDLGATASGVIRKSDGAIDISGTYIPAYGLNSVIGEIPLLGELLTGGNKEGVLGITYAMGGTIAKPKYQMNPLSFLAPGILRKVFEYEQTACGSRRTRIQATKDSKTPY